MNILSWEEMTAQKGKVPRAMTIGVFDGVHLGHQRLLAKVAEQDNGLCRTVVTFKENPKKLLHPATYKGSLFSLDQKLSSFENAGMEACVLIDFSQNFGKLTGVEFLSGLAAGGAKYLCVGPNFRCGHKMDTDAQALVSICISLGVKAEILEPVMHNGHPVSSSRIRTAILDGRLTEARVMLGREYEIPVTAIDNDSSETLIFIVPEDAVLPPEGLYLVKCRDGKIEYEAEAEIAARRVCIHSTANRRWEKVAIAAMLSKE